MSGERCLVTLHPPISVQTFLRVLDAVRPEFPEAMVESGPDYRILVPEVTSVQDGADAAGGLVNQGSVSWSDSADDDAQSGSEPAG